MAAKWYVRFVSGYTYGLPEPKLHRLAVVRSMIATSSGSRRRRWRRIRRWRSRGVFNRKSRAWRTSSRGNDGGSARTGLTKTTTRRTTNTTDGKQQQPETTLADFDDGFIDRFIDRFDERLIHYQRFIHRRKITNIRHTESRKTHLEQFKHSRLTVTIWLTTKTIELWAEAHSSFHPFLDSEHASSTKRSLFSRNLNTGLSTSTVCEDFYKTIPF